jgi:hypothetical protein
MNSQMFKAGGGASKTVRSQAEPWNELAITGNLREVSKFLFLWMRFG